MIDAPPSRLLRAVLRADALATSPLGVVVLLAVLFALFLTGSVVGIVGASVLFAVWVGVGLVGRRHGAEQEVEVGPSGRGVAS